MSEFTVNFLSHHVKVKVNRGTDILSAALKAGIVLNSSCGGEGLCGKCKVMISGLSGYKLACESLVENDMEVTVPAESVEFFEKEARPREGVDEFAKGVVLKREKIFERSPLVKKIYIKVPKLAHGDDISDLDRITREVEGRVKGLLVSARPAGLKHLGDILRESEFKVTVTLAYRDGVSEITTVEPGDTTKEKFGLAFDIGTTTIAAQLIDLSSGKILGSRMSYNKQAQFGSDVITRIIYGSEAAGLKKLNDAVLENMNEIIDDLEAAYKVGPGDISAVVCAGNTTMTHLLLKMDPSGIRREPYIPAASAFPPVRAGELGLDINPKSPVYCAPLVASYIGGDIVSGVLACGLSEDEDLSLLIDIGTNGEVVLGNKEWMMGCSASAGPAFEGSGLASGMKAVKGAIQKVSIGKDLEARYETVEGGKPKGICGSGYIDLLKEMFKRRVITKDGKIDGSIKSRRIRKTDTNYEYVVAFKDDAASGKDIVIQEDDIENLKRAKGALYSAIVTLLNKVGKSLPDLRKVYIAGGFGNYINIDNAVAIGLLPDIERRLYEFVGNTSLAGARMSLLSEEAYSKMSEIRKAITYIDLGTEPGYMDEYIAALFFPHTDIARFPSVRS